MKARAPGKLVLSGAYSVLYGAPALVTAVGRYVVADTRREPRFVAPEVRAALAAEGRTQNVRHPDFDASALRDAGGSAQKLGLGSSAALTVACLGAVELELAAAPLADAELAARVYQPALRAHHAVHGGSGVDVAAACFGGTLSAELHEGELQLAARPLPSALIIEVYWSRRAASTASFVAQVRRLAAEEPARFARLMGAQAEAATATSQALSQGDVSAAIAALRAQAEALRALGAAAHVDIIIPELAAALPSAPSDEAWLPAGAGGGDVTLRYYPAPARAPTTDAAPPPSAIEALGERLELDLGARGVHAFDPTP
ncbi:MAG: hypothetical protein KIT72_14755 [Polyangiaceae bacterium]|nr:hypothetical protein [Polyangiaceae bacterium]MCW5791675.1 hypothetical protein [Polyangiaceae bacterium]